MSIFSSFRNHVQMLQSTHLLTSFIAPNFRKNGFYTEGSSFCQKFSKKSVKTLEIQSNNYFCNDNNRYVQLVSNDFFKQKERQ